ncbi:hypothetical protein AALO_G00109310, partial [Alosa alosa]
MKTGPRQAKKTRAEDPVSEEEEPVAEISGTRRGKGAARSRERGRGRGRGQGRGRGCSHSRQESGDAEPWLRTDIQDTIPPQPTFRPMRTPGPQRISAQYTILELFLPLFHFIIQMFTALPCLSFFSWKSQR